MTTQTKHDGYAVFSSGGALVWQTIDQSEYEAMRKMGGGMGWHRFKHSGYTVRPVTIKEVKDDE